MTTFGVDLSSHPANWAALKATGASFIISRCIEEPGAVDPTYAPTQAEAATNGLIGGAYCFLTADIPGLTVEQRAAKFIAAVGDPTGKLMMLDTERPGYHPAPTGNDVNRFAAVWRTAHPDHPLLNYLPRWYWSGLVGRPDLHAVGPLVASDYRTGWTSFAAYTANKGDTHLVWTTPYAGYPGPSIWQFAGSVGIGGTSYDLNAFRGTRDDLLKFTGGGQMYPVETRTPLGAPTPRAWHVAKGTTLSGYDVKHPNTAFKTTTFTADSMAHCVASVSVAWFNPDGTAVSAPPLPNGAGWLEVNDGTYAGLLIPASKVTLDPAAPAYTAADLTNSYNSGVTAASTAALTAKK